MKLTQIITIIALSFISIEVCANDNKIIPDDYPVTNQMLKEFHGNHQVDSIFALDKAWFKNDSLQEVLIFELYTDYHRVFVFHCKSDFLLSSFLDNIALHRKMKYSYEGATFKEKRDVIMGFYHNAEEIDASFFTSNHGVRLGIPQRDLINLFGKANKIEKLDDKIEVLIWDFEGDLIGSQSESKKLAKDSFGFGVTAYFLYDKLVGIICRNDIP